MQNEFSSLSALRPGDIADPAGCPVRVQRLGSCFIVRLIGAIDLTSAPYLYEQLRTLVPLGDVVVDMTHVASLDDAALDAISTAHTGAASCESTFCLTGAADTVLRQLEAAHPDGHLSHYGDLTEAIESALQAREGEGDGSGEDASGSPPGRPAFAEPPEG